MKFATISSSLIILFVSSTNGSINNQFDEQVARSYLRTDSEQKKSGKSSRCNGSPFNGNELLCNDYAAAVKDDRYDFTYEGAESMYGAKVMSGIDPLPDHLKDMFEVEQHFPNPGSNFIGTLNAVGMHPGLGGGTFGDFGYDNPGRGGVNNFDIYTLLSETVTLSAWGQYYVGSEGTSCQDHSSSDCHFLDDFGGFTAYDQPWWSRPEDSEGLTILESKNQEVSQVCWRDGLTGNGVVMDQAIRCDFKKGTRMMVALGSWRMTNDSSLKHVDSWGCDNGDWDHPQKAATTGVYQYLIPMNQTNPIENFPVYVSNCWVCPTESDDELVDDIFPTDPDEKEEKCWSFNP